MFEILNYPFMIRALIAGISVGIAAPLIGNFLVARRYSLIADTLAHVSLAGVALGLIIGINPVLTALAVSILASVTIERLRQQGKVAGESALAMLLSGGLALAIVLIGVSQKANVDLFSYLFGSITTVSLQDLYFIVPLSLFVTFMVIIFYKELLFVSFDEESAKVSGVPVRFINYSLMIVTAIVTAVSIRTVGSLLIGALVVIPVQSAIQVSKSFKQSVIYSMIFSLLAVILGLVAAFYLNLPAGGSIVLVSLVLYLLSLSR